MMKVSSNQTPTAIGMRTGLAELDETVAATIKSYYAEPIKIAVDGRRFHLAVTSVRESEALVLARLATTFGRDGTLEIGLALGGSAVAIAAAAQSMGYAPHVVLDPFQSHFGYVGLRELEKAGVAKVDYREECSEDFLHDAVREKKTFAFVFNDAGKGLGQALTDGFFINRVLRPGGIVAFHDGLIFSHAVVWRFFVDEMGYTPLPLPTDGRIRTVGRIVRYGGKIGFRHCARAVPKMHHALFALQKPMNAPTG